MQPNLFWAINPKSLASADFFARRPSCSSCRWIAASRRAEILQTHRTFSIVAFSLLNSFCEIKYQNCRASIEFLFYLNLNLHLKIDATCGIDRIIKFGCNLMARKRLTTTKIL